MKYEGYVNIKTVSVVGFSGDHHPGYHILDMIDCETSTPSTPVYPPSNGMNNGYQPSPSYGYVALKSPLFVLGKTIAQVEDENLTEIKRLKGELVEFKNTSEKLKNSIDDNCILERRIEDLKELVDQVREEMSEHREGKEEILRDMRKITKAYGEKAIGDLLR